ncbi:MAG TPA: ABC transporter ATP-binding protein [Actinomycetota bacterium]|nr:ABC transporter ATP-binding protein [Actinomycetota bacterium]
MTAVSLHRVTVSFDENVAVQDLSVDVQRGAWIGLIGPNGAGKSTLLRAIAGLVAFSGEVALDGRPMSGLPRREVARLVAFVPQKPVTPEGMIVTDYVLMGRTPYIPYLGSESDHDLRIVGDVLDRLDLRPLATRPLGSLSGGELQRVVLARALAQQAPVLLLDEPTSALDVGHQQQVLELVDELRSTHALTVVSAMHDLTLAGQFADDLMLLNGGRAVGTGSARTVLTESAIREHYGATVRVVVGDDGEIVVIPTRRSTPLDEGALGVAATERPSAR